jgi:hypothetical protein
MIPDPCVLAHARRRALWLLVFAGILLHACLCPPAVRAEALRTCVSHGHSAAAVSDADGPCAPPVHPHHHQPCGALNHTQQRTAGSGQDWDPGCALPVTAADRHAGPVSACPRWRSSRPPAARSGAGLLIDLCSART